MLPVAPPLHPTNRCRSSPNYPSQRPFGSGVLKRVNFFSCQWHLGSSHRSAFSCCSLRLPPSSVPSCDATSSPVRKLDQNPSGRHKLLPPTTFHPLHLFSPLPLTTLTPNILVGCFLCFSSTPRRRTPTLYPALYFTKVQSSPTTAPTRFSCCYSHGRAFKANVTEKSTQRD